MNFIKTLSEESWNIWFSNGRYNVRHTRATRLVSCKEMNTKKHSKWWENSNSHQNQSPSSIFDIESKYISLFIYSDIFCALRSFCNLSFWLLIFYILIGIRKEFIASFTLQITHNEIENEYLRYENFLSNSDCANLPSEMKQKVITTCNCFFNFKYYKGNSLLPKSKVNFFSASMKAKLRHSQNTQSFRTLTLTNIALKKIVIKYQSTESWTTIGLSWQNTKEETPVWQMHPLSSMATLWKPNYKI